MDTIVHPVDRGTEHSEATAHAVALAVKHDATLHAVFVVDTTDVGDPALSSTAVVIGEYEDEGRALLSEVEQAGDEHGVPVETRCCHGDPTEAVQEYADSVDADLIVVEDGGETRRLDRADERVVVA